MLTFAGRRWRIDSVDHEKKLVDLTVSQMGKLPRTKGGGLAVHTRVRQEMKAILASGKTPVWMDSTASSLLRDAQKQYTELQLGQTNIVVEGGTLHLFLWQGDQIQDSMVALLAHEGLSAESDGICISIKHASSTALAETMKKIASKACPSPSEVVSRKQALSPEKWDWVLPDDLFIAGYASRALAIEEAHLLCRSFAFDSTEG